MKKNVFSRLFQKRKSEYDEEGHDGYDWYEGQTRWPMTRIVEVAFAIISVLVWGIILFRIFSSGNAEYEKMILLNEAAAEHYPAQVQRIHSSTEGQEDGNVMIYYPVYLEETENLQFTARVNTRNLIPGSGEEGYLFLLRESYEGQDTYHELSYFSMDQSAAYRFYRLCFEGVELNQDAIYTFLVFKEGYEAPPESELPYPASDALFQFTVCNSDTYVSASIPEEKIYKNNF